MWLGPDARDHSLHDKPIRLHTRASPAVLSASTCARKTTATSGSNPRSLRHARSTSTVWAGTGRFGTSLTKTVLCHSVSSVPHAGGPTRRTGMPDRTRSLPLGSPLLRLVLHHLPPCSFGCLAPSVGLALPHEDCEIRIGIGPRWSWLASWLLLCHRVTSFYLSSLQQRDYDKPAKGQYADACDQKPQGPTEAP